MEMWKASRSLRFTGTADVRDLILCSAGDVPFRISPTSSIVRSLPASAGLVVVEMPPRYPQSRTLKMTFCTSRVQSPLYLAGLERFSRKGKGAYL